MFDRSKQKSPPPPIASVECSIVIDSNSEINWERDKHRIDGENNQ